MGITQFEDDASDAEATGIYFQEQTKVFNCLSPVGGDRGDFVSNNVDDSLQNIYMTLSILLSHRGSAPFIRREPQWADVAYVVRQGDTETPVASIDPYRGEIGAAPIDIK